MPLTRSNVRWRDAAPPRYVTDTKEGLSGCSSPMVRARVASSASFFGGKNSKEYVLPAARRSAILVTW